MFEYPQLPQTVWGKEVGIDDLASFLPNRMLSEFLGHFAGGGIFELGHQTDDAIDIKCVMPSQVLVLVRESISKRKQFH